MQKRVQRNMDVPSWLYQGPVSQMLAISNCPLPSSQDNIILSWGFSYYSSATLTILWDKATIMIINSMQLEKSSPNRWHRPKPYPPRLLHVHHEHSHRAWCGHLLWARCLLPCRGKKRQGLVSSVPKTSGAQSGEAKQPLRHRTPEPKGREGKEPQKSWK